MTAKEYLQNIRTIDREIDSLCDEVERAKSKVMRVTTSFNEDPVQGSTGNSYEEYMAVYLDLKDKVDKTIDVWVDRKNEAKQMIKALPKSDERTVLRLRYISGHTWTKVACLMYKTNADNENIDNIVRVIHFIHARALKSFENYHCLSLSLLDMIKVQE